MRLIRFFCLGLLLALAAPAFADDKPLKGVALVIGESGYSGALRPLANPKSDARAMDELLGDLGFDVTRVLDGDGRKLTSEIADFVEAAKDADVALVYYSGHGIEAGGENYLVPLDADLSTPQEAGATLIPVSALLDELAKTVPVTIVLLDACRTNAFPAGTMIQPPGASAPVPAVEAGLAELRGPTPVARAGVPATNLGMVIGFAASPGQSALDGAPGEENSPYAAALLKHLSAGGYSFADLMTMVGEEVYLKTKAQQLPWVNSSLRRVLSFGAPVENPDPDERAIRDGRRQLLLSIAADPEATRDTVESIASAEGVPLDALYGMLKVLGVDTSGGTADLQKQLEEGARQLKSFKEQELGAAGSDPELVRLAGLAARAQDEGAIELALKYREQATARARVLAGARDQLEAGLRADRIEIGGTFAQHAQTAALNFDYRTAAQMFGEAYAQVSKWDDDLALAYKRGEAESLRNFGDFKADNDALRQAIDAYRSALLLAPRDKKLNEWVAISTNLGWTLETLGERLSDTAALDEALTVLQSALAAVPADTTASDLANIRLDIGNAISVLGQRDGDPARLQQAVDAYGEALAELPRAADPYTWGKLQYNLGAALWKLGERDGSPDTLTRSVTAFEVALGAIGRDLSPIEWAQAQNGYGGALIALGERTHDVPALRKGIEALNRALTVNTEDRVPLAWAMAQSNLGSGYVALSDETGDPAAPQQAVTALRASLRQLPADKFPLLFATVQSNLGTALTALAEQTGERDSLNEAVAAFEAALEVRTEQNDPPAWAVTEFNLANPLMELGSTEVNPQHLLQAIDAVNAALRQWRKETEPVSWAKAHYSLGQIYMSLGHRGTTSDDFKRAADAYAATLEVFHKLTDPDEWLASTKKYGVALQMIGERDNAPAYLQRAADLYREAAAAIPVEADPVEFGRINFNLGLCLLNLGAFGTLPDGFTQAAVAFRAALQGYSRQQSPDDWADTQFRLGFSLHSAASALPTGGVDELKQAVIAYQAAQEITTLAANPLGWAQIEDYVASAYALLGTRAADRAALQQGRAHLQAAWDVYRLHGAGHDAEIQQRLAQFDAAIAGPS
jgi:uncharacterized caspase-like protein